MGITLGSNIAALSATRRLAENTADLGKSFERLSSGLRINRAADDAAGLAIASGLNVDKKVFTQAIRNANDGISMLAIAEGGVSELSNILLRLRELATQSASGGISLSQRRSLDEEAFALTEEYNRITASTEFNKRSLLEAGVSEVGIQLGYGTESSIGVTTGEQLGRAVGTGLLTETGVGIPDDAAAGILAGDFNEDGFVDLAFSDDSAVYVYVNDGSGGFSLSDTVIGDMGIAGGVGVGDYNNDGHLDLVSYVIPVDTVQFFIGDGSGTFSNDVESDAEGEILSFGESADFDGDGIDDLLIARDGTGAELVVGFNDGDGNFTFTDDLSFPMNSESIGIGDFNGDGHIDIFSGAASGGSSAAVLINDGSGGFTETILSQSGLGGTAAAGDLNHDGYDDLATINSAGVLTAFLSNGDGTFSSLAIQSGFGGTDVEVADMNGDGVLDILTTGGGELRMAVGNGDGTFQTPQAASTATNDLLLVADFNQDSANDAALGAYSGDPWIFLTETENANTLPRLNLLSQEHAMEAMAVIDAAMVRVAAEKGELGALTSRFETAVNNLATSRENFAEAESRILDVDVADESANLVRAQILQEASAAVLAQANQLPAFVLNLLDN